MLATEVTHSIQESQKEQSSVLPIRIFIINLARAGERWERACHLLDQAGMNYERIEAVDGKVEKQLCEKSTFYPPPLSKWFRPLTTGEVACALSHRKAWQKMIDENIPQALILEDDFVLEENWLIGLRALLGQKHEFDLVKLSRAQRKNLKFEQNLDNGFSLTRSYPVPIDAVATLISNQGAKKLIAGNSKVLRPVDYEFKNYWEFGLDIYSVYPNLFSQVDLQEMDSYIGHRAAYRDYPLLGKVKIYLRKYAYQTLHRFYGFFNRP